MAFETAPPLGSSMQLHPRDRKGRGKHTLTVRSALSVSPLERGHSATTDLTISTTAASATVARILMRLCDWLV
jgi:hypothetical protein